YSRVLRDLPSFPTRRSSDLDVRYRGIAVGQIDAVNLVPDLGGVLITARLTAQSRELARSGSRFWVVRPQLHLTRVEGQLRAHDRSEEHTSELQSRFDLVCRL